MSPRAWDRDDPANRWDEPAANPCGCGSGHERYPLHDAAGIFCRYVCEACEKEVRGGYNPAIFESGRYAATGEEDDLFSDF